MNKELDEALKFVKMLLNVGNSEKHLLNLSSTDIRFELIKIEKALTELQSIKNTSPNESIECLERIDKEYGTIECDDFDNCFTTIKQYILKAQEQEFRNEERMPNKEILYLKQSLEQYNDKPIFYISRTYGNKYIVPQKQLDDLVKEKELLEATIEDFRKEINLPKEQEIK